MRERERERERKEGESEGKEIKCLHALIISYILHYRDTERSPQKSKGEKSADLTNLWSISLIFTSAHLQVILNKSEIELLPCIENVRDREGDGGHEPVGCIHHFSYGHYIPWKSPTPTIN